jgi:hypothetical protein
VADLLECLIQVKGVADTPRRLAQRVSEALDRWPSRDLADRQARHVTNRLLAAERRFYECLSLMLARDRPTLPDLGALEPPDDIQGPAADGQMAFETRRADTVRVLERCSADQLNRIGIEPSRGPMTVADLVAVMLAHDTDRLGELVIR